MASFQVINAVCKAVVKFLELNYRREDFGDNALEFEVYMAKDFSKRMNAGVSLFLYRIFFNGNHRIPGERFGKDGKRYKIHLPVDLHFLLTAWGKDASLQHTIAGWMMRTLEDNPILPAGFLNEVSPGVFHEHETVEIILADLKTEDLLRLWEVTAQNEYQISVPYLARNVSIESTQLLTVGTPVQERDFYIVRG